MAPDSANLTSPGFLARFVAGEETAFKHVFDTYWNALCAFASRYVSDPETAEDIVQGVFVRLARNPQSYSGTRSLPAYLYAATRNAALDVLRHRQVRDSITNSDDTLEALALPSVQPDAEIQNAEIVHAVHNAMQSLSPRVRLVAMHRLYDGLSRKEIAELLGVSPETVHKQLSTAMAVLREQLKNIR